jgi:hypothetical protein
MYHGSTGNGAIDTMIRVKDYDETASHEIKA